MACLVPGCAPPPPEPLALPTVLAFGVPSPHPAVLAFADTATFTIDAGPVGELAVTAAHAGVAEISVRPRQGEYRVQVKVPRLHATYHAPPAGPVHMDEDDLDGSFLLAVDARGHVEVVERPGMSAALTDVTSAEGLVRPLFVRLPGAPAEVGSAWTDTVATMEEDAQARTRTESVITTTLVGDTVHLGRWLLVLRTRSENRIESEGRSGGVPVTQRLTGATEGTVLWDPRRRTLIERRESGTLSGTLEMPGATGAVLPVSAAVRRSVVVLEDDL